jgi:transposase InsO family protein
MTDFQTRALEIAAWRYRIIAEAAEAQGQGVAEAISEAAAAEHLGLDGTRQRISERTLWRWLAAYRAGGLKKLMPKQRKDAGSLRAMSHDVLERAAALRREKKKTRATKTIIDILERTHKVKLHQVKRSTLDRHLDHLGLSRRRLGKLGKKTFGKVETHAPFELVIADFHHGPYVRDHQGQIRRALLLCFIDHFSRYILEGRYYLAEDFAVLRFGFRRLLQRFGTFAKLYIDNGPSFQTARFHAACSNEAINIVVVHSKAYVSEGRGCCERFNRTTKEQFESEVRGRDEAPSLDELNGYYEAWLAERYHSDIHSETNQAPFERFKAHAVCRPAPDMTRVDELLRLRKPGRVHKKWSTVEVKGTRYLVDVALRGRKVFVLYDAFDPAYVLIEHDRQIVQRAYPQKPGQQVPQPEEPETPEQTTDYLELLVRDYQARTQAELTALNLRKHDAPTELSLTELVAIVTTCRAQSLSPTEHGAVSAMFRKLRPIDPQQAQSALDGARRRLGTRLHVGVYLDALSDHLCRQRAKGGKKA